MQVKQCMSHIITLEVNCAQAQENQSAETHAAPMHIALGTDSSKLGRDWLKLNWFDDFDDQQQL